MGVWSFPNKRILETIHVYVYMTIESIEQALGRCHQKSCKVLKELVNFGLVEQKKQGLGKPTKLYVHNFGRIWDANLQKYETHTHGSMQDIPAEVCDSFLVLKDWHGNHELYHKIGYLIASGTLTLQKVFDLSKDKTKDDFRESLDSFIRDSIKIKGNYSDLSYEKPLDQKKITTLLLLFNVESVRRNGEHSQWFPFDKYKFGKSGKVTWSLEHIHAQQSEGLRTQEMWKEWLTLHIPSVKSVSDTSEELIELMENAIQKEKLERQEFDAIQQKVVELLSVKGNAEYLHSIANMALLSSNDNAALNNSTFDVKRNEIIKMDKAGQYIPFCTRMVFLKYYTPSADNQLHFWGHSDRVAYVDAMNTVLVNYLEEPIVLEKGED